MSSRIFELLNLDQSYKIEPFSGSLQGVSGTSLDIMGTCSIPLVIGKDYFQQKVVIADIDQPAILGSDFLSMHNAIIDYGNRQLVVKNKHHPLLVDKMGGHCCRVTLKENVTFVGRHFGHMVCTNLAQFSL